MSSLSFRRAFSAFREAIWIFLESSEDCVLRLFSSAAASRVAEDWGGVAEVPELGS